MVSSREHWNQVAFDRAEAAYLTPPDPDTYDYPVGKCDKCGIDLYVGDVTYEGYDGERLCEDCFREMAQEHSETLEAPEPQEPDWDSMPGGADSDI